MGFYSSLIVEVEYPMLFTLNEEATMQIASHVVIYCFTRLFDGFVIDKTGGDRLFPVNIHSILLMSSIARSLTKRAFRRSGSRIIKTFADPAISLLRKMVPSLPPKWDASGHFRRKMRYAASTAGTNAVGVTINDLFGALGGTCTTTNSTLTCWFSSVKINSVCIFMVGGSNGSVIWNSPTTGIGRDTEPNTSIVSNTTQPHCIKSTPPRASMSGDWINSTLTSTTLLFTCVVPQGAVVDVSIEMTLSNSYTPQQVVIGTGLNGNPYYLALDGPTTNNLRPIDLPTTH